MTKFDLELRLRQAAAALPEPEGSLTVVESRSAKGRRNPLVYVVAAVIVAALLIPTCVAITGNLVGKVNGTSLTIVNRYGFHPPEALGEFNQICRVNRVDVVDESVVHWEAPSQAEHTWMYMDYEKDEYNSLTVFFCQIGADGFGYDCLHMDRETGEPLFDEIFTPNTEGADASYEMDDLNVVEYRGCTIYLYDRVGSTTEDGFFGEHGCEITDWRDPEARWVDEQSGMVFRLAYDGVFMHTAEHEDGTVVEYMRDYQMMTQEELLDYVKIIIDAQR